MLPKVKVVDELVSSGGTMNSVNMEKWGGEHLSPSQVRHGFLQIAVFF